jgi:hypothetical protein
MPPPPQPEVEIKEEVVEEPIVAEAEVIVEPSTPKAREEIMIEAPPKKVVAKKTAARSKKTAPVVDIAVC